MRTVVNVNSIFYHDSIPLTYFKAVIDKKNVPAKNKVVRKQELLKLKEERNKLKEDLITIFGEILASTKKNRN